MTLQFKHQAEYNGQCCVVGMLEEEQKDFEVRTRVLQAPAKLLLSDLERVQPFLCYLKFCKNLSLDASSTRLSGILV